MRWAGGLWWPVSVQEDPAPERHFFDGLRKRIGGFLFQRVFHLYAVGFLEPLGQRLEVQIRV